MSIIVIHWDFTVGNELSHAKVQELIDLNDGRTINTHCLNFFTTELNAIVVKENGDYISSIGLLVGDSDYTHKEIRREHNLEKMIIAGSFAWKKFDWSSLPLQSQFRHGREDILKNIMQQIKAVSS